MRVRAKWVVAGAVVGLTFLLISGFLASVAPRSFAADEPEKPAEAQSPQDDDLSFEERIYKALERPIDARFSETPLVDVALYFKTALKIPVVLDEHALEALDIEPDVPVTLDQRGISAKAALRLILRRIGLTYTVRREALTITTPEGADCILTVKLYDVADLVAVEAGEDDDAKKRLARFDPVIDLITSCCAPTTWDDVGGPGSIRAFEAAGIKTVAVSQTHAVHEQVEALLRVLRSARHGESPAKFRARPVGSVTTAERQASKGKDWATSPHDAAVLAKLNTLLDQRLTGKAERFSLRSAVAYLKDHAKLPVELDTGALKDVEISGDTEVTLELDGRLLRIALSEMLRPIGLTWLIQDEVILITTPEEADSRLITVVYDVTDLASFRLPNGKVTPDYEELKRLITTMIQPTVWDEIGGPGSIASFHRGGIQVLIVSQCQAGHEQITDLLAMLRKLRGHEPTKEELDGLPAPLPLKEKTEDAETTGGSMGGGLF